MFILLSIHYKSFSMIVYVVNILFSQFIFGYIKQSSLFVIIKINLLFLSESLIIRFFSYAGFVLVLPTFS